MASTRSFSPTTTATIRAARARYSRRCPSACSGRRSPRITPCLRPRRGARPASPGANGSGMESPSNSSTRPRRRLKAVLRAPALLPADALLVPHHGSATSSTPEFVKQVAPRHAVFAVGHRNRFGHPREDVLERYREAGSELLRTDTGGAIQLRFAPGGLRVYAERDRARRYWHEL